MELIKKELLQKQWPPLLGKLAAKAKHSLLLLVPLLQKQYDPVAHVRTSQCFYANPVIKYKILLTATLHKESKEIVSS